MYIYNIKSMRMRSIENQNAGMITCIFHTTNLKLKFCNFFVTDFKIRVGSVGPCKTFRIINKTQITTV